MRRATFMVAAAPQQFAASCLLSGSAAPSAVVINQRPHDDGVVVASPQSPSPLSSSSASMICVTAVAVGAHRFLRVAQSPHGYYIRRRGQFMQNMNPFRRPFYSNPHATKFIAPFFWHSFSPSNPNAFLPKANYVTGPWTGLYAIPRDQVYTLQHCTANVPLRVRRFPTFFEYTSHSRWMIGKGVRSWVEPRAHIFDEAALTKRARLGLVKKGLLPPG